MREQKFCDVCGKDLTCQNRKDGSSMNVIGIQLSVSPRAFAEQVLFPYEARDYNICFPCWLKSLGVSPPEVYRDT